jgi:hypothetical protein
MSLGGGCALGPSLAAWRLSSPGNLLKSQTHLKSRGLPAPLQLPWRCCFRSCPAARSWYLCSHASEPGSQEQSPAHQLPLFCPRLTSLLKITSRLATGRPTESHSHTRCIRKRFVGVSDVPESDTPTGFRIPHQNRGLCLCWSECVCCVLMPGDSTMPSDPTCLHRDMHTDKHAMPCASMMIADDAGRRVNEKFLGLHSIHISELPTQAAVDLGDLQLQEAASGR